MLSKVIKRSYHSSKLVIKRTTAPVQKLPYAQLQFGKSFTDHMLECDHKEGEGWGSPLISPLHNFSIDPSASSLHYALECFEGMKAYKDAKGTTRLFRPYMNFNRLQRSMDRIGLPKFDKDEFLKCLKELLKVDEAWIPKAEGYSLYIRPTAISTHASLAIENPKSSKLFVICSPVGPYYPEGFKPITLYADNNYVRAWPGGTGDTKLGGNYGPTILPQMEAAKKGYSQVLWLYGKEEQVTEVGTMNIFFLLKNKDGETELITPTLDGTILPGITRDSVLNLTRGYKEFKVTEKVFYMDEIVQALKEKRVIECFGCGTAAIVTPVKKINYGGVDYDVPINAAIGAGNLTKRVWQSIVDIQYGRTDSEWSLVC